MTRLTLGVRRIARIVLMASDVARLADFYRDALGFQNVPGHPCRVVLRLGGAEIELIAAHRDARPYPRSPSANDPWFQHFAIRVSDISAAYARLARHPHTPITRGGPQRLPPSTGSVTAYKFRDPEGHPLELSHIPGRDRPSATDSPFIDLDHTALVVCDLETSLAFYTRDLGLRAGPRRLNRGAEQDRLDDLDGVELDIAILKTAEPGPHIELLHYRAPTSSVPGSEVRPGDIAATCTELIVPKPVAAAGPADGEQRGDPDGHLLTLRIR